MLGIYAGSVVICYIVNALIRDSVAREAKKWGYVFKSKVEKNTLKRILIELKLFAAAAFPILNVIYTYVISVMNSRMKDQYIDACISDGTLVKTDNDEGVKIFDLPDDIEVSKETSIELSNEEKIRTLKEEKQILLGQAEIYPEETKIKKYRK